LERLRIYEGEEIGDNLEGNLTRRWGTLKASKDSAADGQSKRIIETRPLLTRQEPVS
jgi:hypothetical protein